MATSSISGLASGLDTAGIVDQLMQLEAVSQNRLKAQQSTQKTVLSALQALNTDVSLLGSKADTLAKAATWQTMKATSSTSAVSVTAGSAATATSFSVTIGNLAVAHQFALTDAHAMTDNIVPDTGSGTTVRITSHDGTVHDLPTGTGSFQEIVTAINGSTASTGVSATALKVADGSYRLLVQSTTTGSASDFTLTNSDGTVLMGGVDGATLRQADDAHVTVGGITATSTTNTFTDLTPGVTLTLASTAKSGDVATVTVARDTSGVKANVKALVDQLNALLGKIDSATAGASGTTPAGTLVGDGTARGLRGALVDTVFGGSGGTSTSMASVGIQTDRYGKLVFDDAAFDKAYAADPTAVAAQFTKGATSATDGWAARVQAVAKTASDSVTGTITTAITGRQTSIDRLGDDIAAWDDRLALRRDSLNRQFTALETALSSLKSQGDWLSGQLASLPKASS